MSSDSHRDAAEGHPDEESFEVFTADCIDVLESQGSDALEELLSTRPAVAERVRHRLGSLSKLGLLSMPEADWSEAIGPYKVVRRLGSGGMGEVLLGQHTESGAQVALKLGPTPQPALTPEHDRHTRRGAERFAREVQAARELSHPCIVPIVDVGTHRGRAWFAMEYVDGVGLDRVLEAVRAGSVAPEALMGADLAAAVPGAQSGAFGATWVGAVVRIVRDIASALVEAHEAGIVHRDIKPSNILLRPDGRVQIVDFGLAHLEDMPTLTLSGEFAGTPYYVAPEQIENSRGGVDGRADVFSLGVTLYECASLHRPFHGRTPLEVLSAISGREPEPLRKVAPYLPPDLERLCRRALEKDPAHRYPGMAEFATDLGRLLEFKPLLLKQLSPYQRSLRWARRRPWRAASLAFGALILVGIPIGLLAANAKIRAERDRVRDEARRQALVVEHFVEHFDRSAGAPDVDEAARSLLDRGARRLEHGLENEPRLRASLLHASARAYLELGRPSDARPLLDRALAMWLREGASANDERALVLADLARVHIAEGRPGIARDLAARALLEMPGTTLAPEFDQRVKTTIAAADIALGDVESARAALEALDPVPEGLRPDAAKVWEAIGLHFAENGAPGSAREAFRASLELHERAWAPDVASLARVHGALADVLDALPALPGDSDSDAAALLHRARSARLDSLLANSDLPPGKDGPAPFLGEPAWAASYSAVFDEGVAALQAGRLDEARALFQEAHDRRPSPAVAAYNLACVESREGRITEAAAWLERAYEAGFACTEGRTHALMHDVEIEALRESPAGQPVMDALEAQWAAARSFAARTVSVPAKTTGPAPLLVVIHDQGETPSEAAMGDWGDVAQSLGASLLVPSAPYLMGAGVENGSSWAPDPRDLWKQPETFGYPILKEVRDVLERGGVDRERVWIAGRGHGALLALDLLLDNPGLFRRGWLVEPLLHERSGRGSGRLPVALGGRLLVSMTEDAPPPEAAAKDADVHARQVEEWLRGAGGWGDSVRVDRRPGRAPQELLEWWSGE